MFYHRRRRGINVDPKSYAWAGVARLRLTEGCPNYRNLFCNCIPKNKKKPDCPYHTIPYPKLDHTIPGRFGGQQSFTDIYHTIPYHTIPCHTMYSSLSAIVDVFEKCKAKIPPEKYPIIKTITTAGSRTPTPFPDPAPLKSTV